jgi:hypothetical protein
VSGSQGWAKNDPCQRWSLGRPAEIGRVLIDSVGGARHFQDACASDGEGSSGRHRDLEPVRWAPRMTGCTAARWSAMAISTAINERRVPGAIRSGAISAGEPGALERTVVGRCENFLHSSELPDRGDLRSASAGVGRSQKAILRARTGRHLTFPLVKSEVLAAGERAPRSERHS